ncbi:MAG: YhgE/Pip family protein [Chlamydiota bacterium]
MSGDGNRGFVAGMRQVFEVFSKEASLFRGRLPLWGAAALIAFIPSLYTVIYVGAIWDPYGNVNRLPAGLVNLDEGTTFRGRDYDLGRKLVGELEGKRSLKFTFYPGEREAEAAVRAGADYFALVVPRDFSAKALAGAGPAALTLITSQGTSFVASLIAERFAGTVKDNLNRTLGVERWRVVLSSGRDARSAAVKMRDGAGRALDGSGRLRGGIERAAGGARAIADNQKKLAGGLGGVDAKKLVESGRMLHGNTSKLASGLSKRPLFDRVTGLPRASDLDRLAKGAAEYQDAIERLGEGIGRASEGAGRLAEKEEELARGMDALREGSAALEKGLAALHEGLGEFAAALPEGGSNPEGLAESVTIRRDECAPVSANGPAFAPYFMALSLWLGVVMGSFLFHLIVFPESVAGAHTYAKILGKGIVPLAISCAGAALLGATVQFLMRIPPRDMLGFYAVLLCAAFIYNTIVLSLVRLIGDAGKLLCVMFLVLQIASAGGAYPIELSPPFFRGLSPIFPLTHVVQALRAALFGSYNGEWGRCILSALPWAAVSLGVSFLSRKRFLYVRDAAYGPALDLSFGRRPL